MKNLMLQYLNQLDEAFYELDDKSKDKSLSLHERLKSQEKFDYAFQRLEELINEKL